MKDFELAVRELVDEYRNKSNRDAAVTALRTQAELLHRDAGWNKSSEDQPDIDLSDPAQNPLGTKPAPAGATRVDEVTAPEPDSGSVADQRAVQAGISKTRLGDVVPPPDVDAVIAKKEMEKVEAEVGPDKETPDSSQAKRKK